MPKVHELIEKRYTSGNTFRRSEIAKRCGISEREAGKRLKEEESRKTIKKLMVVKCPTCKRAIGKYSEISDLPEKCVCTKCGVFEFDEIAGSLETLFVKI